MTTDFLPQDDSNFTPIRFFSALDPYHYSIDNRPLQDIETNLKNSRSGGADAARRAAALTALAGGSIASGLFTTPGNTRGMSGLQASQTVDNVLRILPGSIYEVRAISATVTDVMTKQALLSKAVDISIIPPTTVGNSIMYTIEGEYLELETPEAMTASGLPYLDSSNTYLPSTLINGGLALSIVAGQETSPGNESPAATTPGKFPIYNVTIAYGAVTFKVALHEDGPYVKGMNETPSLVPLSVGGAGQVIANEMQVCTFADSVTSGVILGTTITPGSVNPYKPIKLKITYSSSAPGGYVTFQIRYKGLATGDLTSIAKSTSAIEYFLVGDTDCVKTCTTSLVIVPNEEFSGFVDNVWDLNKHILPIILERVGESPYDSNAGTITVLGVSLIQ